MIKMLIQVLVIDQDVIKIHNHKFTYKYMQHMSEFVSQNNMIIHSCKPFLIINAVFHSSPSFIIIWWCPLFKLILKKIHDSCNSSSMSSNLGIRCLYFTVVLLMARQSTYPSCSILLRRKTLAHHKGSYSHEYTPSSSAHQLSFETLLFSQDYFYRLVG